MAAAKKRDEDDTIPVSAAMARKYAVLQPWRGHWVRIMNGRPVHSGSLCRKCNGGRS